MNREMMKKAVAGKVVDMAVQAAKMPNQICFIAFGKSKTNYNLTTNDYESLESFINRG
ncbi:MAG: hypothetical protein IKL06_07505 [Lachnospiraceae bacterium]|nr:hypothetical protein [Lachnospiraceae bacterium]